MRARRPAGQGPSVLVKLSRYGVQDRLGQVGAVMAQPEDIIAAQFFQQQRYGPHVVEFMINAYRKLRSAFLHDFPGALQSFELGSLNVHLDVVDLIDLIVFREYIQ